MIATVLFGIEALLISNPVNIRYLTGFIGAAPEEREAYVLLVKNNTYLFTNSLYIEQAKKTTSSFWQASPPVGGERVQNQTSDFSYEVTEISREKPLTTRIKEVLESLTLPPTVKLGFEEVDLTVAEYKILKQELPDIQLLSTRDRIENRRMIKRPDEINNIKKACKITDDCFVYVAEQLKSGVTESEIIWEIESFFRKNDATNAFSPIVAFNQNSSNPHYIPTKSYKLTANNLILLDFGARCNGYCADMTRVIFFGKPTIEQKKTYEIVLAAQQKALDLLQSGERSGATLDIATRAIIENAGLPPYPHSLGHNVGLAIHEGPRLSAKRNETLLPGMVFSIEPGIYLEGKFGVRIEDLVYITEENKIEVLSKSSKEFITV